ncbi:MAG TPA: translation initiation factor IF-2 [Fibrobacteria bacterium]|nr:translation initiation factor IF-2 [Fibrobacteria bacterium]
MSKTRITDVATEFEIAKESVLKHLKDAGFEVRSVLSPIESDWVDKIRPALENERAKSGKPRAKKAAPKKKAEGEVETEKPKKAAPKKKAEGEHESARSATPVAPVSEKPAPVPPPVAAPVPVPAPAPVPPRVEVAAAPDASVAAAPKPAPKPEPASESVAPATAPAPTAPPVAPAPEAAPVTPIMLTAPVRRQPSFNPDRPDRPRAPASTYQPTPRGITGGPRPGFNAADKGAAAPGAASREQPRDPRPGDRTPVSRDGRTDTRGPGGPRPDRGGAPNQAGGPRPDRGVSVGGNRPDGRGPGGPGGPGQGRAPYGGGQGGQGGYRSGAPGQGGAPGPYRNSPPSTNPYRPNGPGGPRPGFGQGPGAGPGGPGRGGFGAPAGGPPGATGSLQPGQQAGAFGAPAGKGSAGRKRKTKEQIETEIFYQTQQNVNKVMVSLDRGKIQRRYARGGGGQMVESPDDKMTLKVAEFITIAELANLLNVAPAQVIAKAMGMGLMVTINARLDHETIAIIADEFGYQAQLMDEYAEDVAESQELIGDPEAESVRPPIVTVMGHVDHGKTSLLDYLRKTHVMTGEAGGITQHIGAYEVDTGHGCVTFLDTPGHEAFSAMRARGAKVTDIVVLVVAADSNVMPQTKEAIDHARAANVPIVVAINKIDLPAANPDNVRAQLGAYGVEVEQWGGKVQCVEISAKKGINMDKLLDSLLIEAEMLGLRANPTVRAKGTVIESRLDKGKGSIATILVQEGTLRVGDAILVGSYAGKIRQLMDERGQPRHDAGPSVPCQILGIDGVPQAGDSVIQMDDEREAREIAGRRLRAQKERELRRAQRMSLEDLSNKIAAGDSQQTLKVIVKGDVDGSVEAIAASLEQLSTKEVRVQILSRAVGGIKEADVMLAAASDAIIVAFHVRPDANTRELASREGVEIRSYRIIYEVVDDIRKAMEGMLKPEIKEEVAAEAEVRAIFRVPRQGAIAGCYVQSGTIERKLKARVYRNGVEIAESKVSTLKRFKDDVSEVKSGYECGVGLDGVDDYQEGDIIAFFRQFEVARKLSDTKA